MASKGDYLSYVKDLEYESQSLYLECSSGSLVAGELKGLGTRRILVMSRARVLSHWNSADFLNKLEAEGFRIFTYVIRKDYADSTDINAALNQYMGYNCDTIVVFGTGDDISCAKMVSAMAVNGIKDPEQLQGFGKIKKDISVLCCVVMDNSPSVSSNSAEFTVDGTGRRIMSFSNYLIPQIAVIDTDIAMRTTTKDSIASALDTLAEAVGCCLIPEPRTAPSDRACAYDAVRLITDNLIRMKDDPDDSFLRKKIAVAGIYAGTASRNTGPHMAHLIYNALYSRTGRLFGGCYYLLMLQYLNSDYVTLREGLANLYADLVRDEIRPEAGKIQGALKPLYSSEAAAKAMIWLFEELYSEAVPERPSSLKLSPDDMRAVFDDVRKEAPLYGYDKIDEDMILSVLKGL